MNSEFDIIRACFDRPGLAAEKSDIIRLGIGDDCALLAVPAGKELAVSMDTLVDGIHFPHGGNPALLGYRSLAVNLSDLAAMGASPTGFTLALTLPDADKGWLNAFSEGLRECAMEFGCPLVGGDTTRGPLAITIQGHGLVESGRAITRSGAASGDRIYVSGSLGAPALAIGKLLEDAGQTPEEKSRWENTFYRPVPRLALGSRAAGMVSAGIDISDGLLADLGHIGRMSHAGADLELSAIPLADSLKPLSPDTALALALTGGDDYELLLTVSEAREALLVEAGKILNVPLHRIGVMTKEPGVRCLDEKGDEMAFPESGYQHFK